MFPVLSLLPVAIEGAKAVKYFMKAFQVMSVVSTWAAQSLVDGKISLREALSLVEQLAPILGVPVAIDLAETDLQALRAARLPGPSADA